MSDLVFVDTNVFVYSVMDSDDGKRLRSLAWLDQIWARACGRVSFQVLQEFYAVCTRLRPDRAGEARATVQMLFMWDPLATDSTVMERAWRVQAAESVSWWDALIIAAAGEANCSVLLTEDLQHSQRFGGLQVLNPFEVQPEAFFAGAPQS